MQQERQIGRNASKQAGMGANMQQWGQIGGNRSRQAGIGPAFAEATLPLHLCTFSGSSDQKTVNLSCIALWHVMMSTVHTF